MTQARDQQLKPTEYKGRPTYCRDKLCPCRPCWAPHDCGAYMGGRWIVWMECVTRWNNGCPHPIPAPVHLLKSRRSRRCLRCGAHPRATGEAYKCEEGGDDGDAATDDNTQHGRQA